VINRYEPFSEILLPAYYNTMCHCPKQNYLHINFIYLHREKAMANYPQELAEDAVCHSHTGHMTGLWFLPSPAFKAEY